MHKTNLAPVWTKMNGKGLAAKKSSEIRPTGNKSSQYFFLRNQKGHILKKPMKYQWYVGDTLAV
jgi:hypothetical protein